MPYPKPKEKKSEYIDRCMSDSEMKSKHPGIGERLAVCNAFFTTQDAIRVSFDYDGTLTTDNGFNKAKEQTGIVYIISARSSKENMLAKAKELGIPESRVYATGSNQEKLNKIKELGINTHYDNNPDVIKKLGKIGKLITVILLFSIYNCSNTSYSDKIAKECKYKEDSLKRLKIVLDNKIKVIEAKNK